MAVQYWPNMVGDQDAVEDAAYGSELDDAWSSEEGRPLPALVSKVVTDGIVDLVIFDLDGDSFARANVSIVPTSDVEHPGCCQFIE